MNINFPESLEFNNNRWMFILKAKASAALRRILLSITFLVTPIQLAKFFAWKLKSFLTATFDKQNQFAQPVSPKFGNSIDYKVALILHVYYPEIGLEILNQVLPKANYFDKILISHNMAPDALSKFKNQIPPKLLAKSKFMWVENRFRDCGPFIAAARSPYLSDCDVFLKLHTKKSPHLPSEVGKIWRQSLIYSLLNSGDLIDLFGRLTQSCKPLWACPDEWIATSSQWGFNSFHVWSLLRQVEIHNWKPGAFPLGNMLWMNRETIQLVRRLNPQKVFTPRGLLDGTFTHAFERFFTGIGIVNIQSTPEERRRTIFPVIVGASLK